MTSTSCGKDFFADFPPLDSPADAAQVTPYLRTSRLGRRLLYFPSLPSTNLTANEFGAAGAAEGLVIVADQQEAGRGRLGRHWFSPPGRNLYATVLLRPNLPPAAMPQLALVTALVIRQAIQEILGELSIGVKWPNDLLLNRGKLAGILCEMACLGQKTSYAMLGFGINVNFSPDEMPPHLQATATSLRAATGQTVARGQLLAAILNHLEKAYLQWCQEPTMTALMTDWANASILDGEMVTITNGEEKITGQAMGITPQGALILKDKQGKEKIILAGEAHIGTENLTKQQ